MDTIESIQTRRSIRKYQDKQVPAKMIEKILRAGMSAPSAGNQQPWHFIIIKDKTILKEIPSIHPNAAMAEEASVAILVCGDLGLETHEGYWVQDCSAATQNILLAAHAIGLGAVWCGIYPRQKRVQDFKKLLNIPHHVIPLALIPIGYPGEKIPKQDRFRKDRVHYDKW